MANRFLNIERCFCCSFERCFFGEQERGKIIHCEVESPTPKVECEAHTRNLALATLSLFSDARTVKEFISVKRALSSTIRNDVQMQNYHGDHENSDGISIISKGKSTLDH